MNVKLLRKVAKHILEEPKRLYMAAWIQQEGVSDGPLHGYAKCGTAACIAGWAKILSGQTGQQLRDLSDTGAILGLTGNQEARLEYQSCWPAQFKTYNDDGTQKSAEIAAARIEHFIKTKGGE